MQFIAGDEVFNSREAHPTFHLSLFSFHLKSSPQRGDTITNSSLLTTNLQRLEQLGDQDTEVITEGIANDTSRMTCDKGLAVFHYRSNHRHNGR